MKKSGAVSASSLNPGYDNGERYEGTPPSSECWRRPQARRHASMRAHALAHPCPAPQTRWASRTAWLSDVTMRMGIDPYTQKVLGAKGFDLRAVRDACAALASFADHGSGHNICAANTTILDRMYDMSGLRRSVRWLQNLFDALHELGWLHTAYRGTGNPHWPHTPNRTSVRHLAPIAPLPVSLPDQQLSTEPAADCALSGFSHFVLKSSVGLFSPRHGRANAPPRAGPNTGEKTRTGPDPTPRTATPPTPTGTGRDSKLRAPRPPARPPSAALGGVALGETRWGLGPRRVHYLSLARVLERSHLDLHTWTGRALQRALDAHARGRTWPTAPANPAGFLAHRIAELPAVPTPTARTHAAPMRGGPDTTPRPPSGPQWPAGARSAPGPPRTTPSGPPRGTARHTAPIRGTSRVAPPPLNPKPRSGSCWPPTTPVATNSPSPTTPARSVRATLWPVNRCARCARPLGCCPHEPCADPLNVLRRSKMADHHEVFFGVKGSGGESVPQFFAVAFSGECVEREETGLL